ncbi:head maturation protease, ClpP-related [Salinicola sp. CPA57]|uniref:head maturation protease, ClpP-related n=1 Tax=Salinicola sp. CPA57 TaxID=1949080 RepID=UPI000DA23435|nr:head maturation protease, ClpP-related [Salinicola sp. CPA57]
MKWFKAEAVPGESNRAHIVIDQPIGSDWAPDWINDFMGEQPAKEFIQAVEALGDLDIIDLEINSPGGDVASGIRIFNYLRNHKATVNVRVTGMAASIATVIMMAGDTRVMAVGSTLMTHRAASLMIGYFTAAEMEAHAKNVKTIDNEIVNVYAMTTGKTAEEVAALLDQGDTYMGADEAIEWGFATDKDAKLQAVACADPQLFKKQIQQEGKIRELQAKLGGNQTMTAADALALAFDITPEEAETQAADLGDQIMALRQSAAGQVEGFEFTVAALRESHPDLVKQIEASATGTEAIQSAVASERARVTSIMKLCNTAGQTQLVDKLVDNGWDETQASEYVYDVAAAGSTSQNINGSHSPEGGHRAKGIDYNKAYARYRKPA